MKILLEQQQAAEREAERLEKEKRKKEFAAAVAKVDAMFGKQMPTLPRRLQKLGCR
ncbi:hypothetical protein [Paraburkholderia sp. UYCP14C]|uniref:hypothetical protein n=1 Tax=Paraburkholderia sp. UYCP14C TaxID=2511130 RepID=UPI001459FDF2|nr:hypothetical protein [Paraburkholderia sp. UYCP14C]